MPFQISPYAAIAVIIFVAVSAVIAGAMAGAGGWRALAARYPAPGATPSDEERYRFISVRTGGGMLGTAYYGSCVTVGVSSRGLSLALWAPFKLFHPPLFIPWEALQSCRRFEHYRRGPWAVIMLKDGGDLTVTARAAEAILRQATERGISDGRETKRGILSF